MNKGDIEFTVDLNTTPAEKKLNDLRNKASSERSYYANLFKDVMQGFSMQGSSYSGYMGANNFGVPAIQNFERSISSVTNTMQKFTMVMEAMVRAQGFLMYGRPYSPQSSAPIYQGSNVAGYLPSSTSPNIRAWTPTEHYTRAQANAINHSKVFDNLIFNRKNGGSDFSQQNVYDTFMRMNNASAMYEMWLNTFPSSPLMLEAPEPISTGAGGNKIYQKYNKFGQPVTEKNKKTKEIVEEQKKVTEENKKDNTEWSHKLFILHKFLGILYAVESVAMGISNIFKNLINTSSELWTKTNTEVGGFSIDAESAMNLQAHREYSVAVAGIQNMGKLSPISLGAFQSGVGQFQNVVQKAMSGQGVDTNKLVAIEQLHRMYGTELTSEKLMSKDMGGKTATQYFFDFMDKFEKNPNVYRNASYSEKGQIRQYIEEVLGKEVADAIVANINKGNIETVHEIISSYGSSAVHAGNFNERNEAIAKSARELQSAFIDLKYSIIGELSPAIISFCNFLNGFISSFGTKDSKGMPSSKFGQSKEQERAKVSGSEIAQLAVGNAEERLNASIARSARFDTQAETEAEDRYWLSKDFIESVKNGNPEDSVIGKRMIADSGSIENWAKTHGRFSKLGKLLKIDRSKIQTEEGMKSFYKLAESALSEMQLTSYETFNDNYTLWSDWGEGGSRNFTGSDYLGYMFDPNAYASSAIALLRAFDFTDWARKNKLGSEQGIGNVYTSVDEHQKITVDVEFKTNTEGATIKDPLQILKSNSR